MDDDTLKAFVDLTIKISKLSESEESEEELNKSKRALAFVVAELDDFFHQNNIEEIISEDKKISIKVVSDSGSNRLEFTSVD